MFPSLYNGEGVSFAEQKMKVAEWVVVSYGK